MRVLRERLSIHSFFSLISGKGNLIHKENAKSICGIQSVFNCYKKGKTERDLCFYQFTDRRIDRDSGGPESKK